MRQVVWNCLHVQYKLHPRCGLTALNALDFSGELRSANKAAIMGVVLHYSIFFMLYMHSLRICFGCLDGKFFSFRLVVSVIFGSLFSKTEGQNSDKHIYLLKEDKKKELLQLARPTLNNSSCKIILLQYTAHKCDFQYGLRLISLLY